MSSLVLIRHGQASLSEATYDALSLQGRDQGIATGVWIRAREQVISELISGPRQRHLETSNLLHTSARLNVAIQVEPQIDEFAEGEEILSAAATMFGTPSNDGASRREQLVQYNQAFNAWARGEVDIPGRQSFKEFRGRINNWFHETISTNRWPSGHQIFAVTSAGVVGAVVCEVLGLPNEQWPSIVGVVNNTSITEIVFSQGRCSLKNFNCTTHLPQQLLSAI